MDQDFFKKQLTFQQQQVPIITKKSGLKKIVQVLLFKTYIWNKPIFQNPLMGIGYLIELRITTKNNAH